MSHLPDRVTRAFTDHAAFEQRGEQSFESVTTPFDGVVTASSTDSGHIHFSIEVTVPVLNDVTEDEVADIVADGWYETFALRVADIGGIFRTFRELSPTVGRHADSVVVTTSFQDINIQRGVEDAGAVIDFVEGTFVQGIIPGYEYTEPVTSIIDQARQAAGGADPV